jgi:hypothetical protein
LVLIDRCSVCTVFCASNGSEGKIMHHDRPVFAALLVMLCFCLPPAMPSVADAQCGECLQWTAESTAPTEFFVGAYDSINGVLIALDYDGNVWVELNGVWVDKSVLVSVPTVIDLHLQFVYSPSQQASFLAFAGFMGKIIYSPDTGNILNPAQVQPPPSLGLFGASLCNFEPRGSLLLFGGYPNLTNDVQDTLAEYDPIGQTYTVLVPADAPKPRSHSAMAYDSSRQRVVLFGGTSDRAAAINSFDDTWEYDGTNWVEVIPIDGVKPAARWAGRMAYDTSRGVMVMVGGKSGPVDFLDTWEWDGSRWTPRFPGESHGAGASTSNRSLAYVQHEGTFRNFDQSTSTYTLAGVAAQPPDVLPPSDPLRHLNMGAFTLLSVSLSSNPPVQLSYQWRKDGLDIPGANASFYVLGPVDESDEGDYDCVVRYPTGLAFDCGNTISDPIHVDVLLPPCWIHDANEDGVINLRDFANFQKAFGQSCP